MNLDELSVEQIGESLQAPAPPTWDVPVGQQGEDRRAGVLMPLLRQGDAWHLLFIRRSESERDHHSGQVAFAGGKWEPGDSDLEQTALREAREEIGILPGDVRILGRLGRHHSVTRFSITPVVGMIPWPYRLRPDPLEVASVFTMPLAWLADPGNLEISFQHITGYAEAVPVAFYHRYEGELLWGATARMTLTLVEQLRRYLEAHGAS